MTRLFFSVPRPSGHLSGFKEPPASSGRGPPTRRELASDALPAALIKKLRASAHLLAVQVILSLFPHYVVQ